MTDRQVLTVSRFRSYLTCPRKHWWKYEQKIRPKESAEALRFGTLWHQRLEDWWNGVDDPRPMDEVDPFHEATVEALMEVYVSRWSDLDYPEVRTEVEFRIPLINPDTMRPSRVWVLGGKIDLLLADCEGNRWLVEHKTTSEDLSEGSGYWARLALDPQLQAYVLGAESVVQGDIHGVLYDVVRKPTTRPRKATPEESRKYKKNGTLYASQRLEDETPAQFGDRVRELVGPENIEVRPIPILDQAVRDAMGDCWDIGQSIRACQLSGRWPRNPGACFHYGRVCSFWDACANGTDPFSDPERFEVNTTANPELSGGGG